MLDFLVDRCQKYGSLNFDQMPTAHDGWEVVSLALKNLEV